MKRGWKIFFVILIVFIIAIGVYTFYTINQAKALMSIADPAIQEKTKADITAVMNGDCSKLPEVEANLQDTINKIKSACSNPALKPIIQQQAPEGVDLCSQVNDPNSDAFKQLNTVRQKCNS
jgi:hypothetical protein